MIPEFPKLKELELSDKSEVEEITLKYLPYSDFNFVSMYVWDTKDEMRISKLNGNLVVLFTDYLTGKPFFSFIGDNMIKETAEKLINFSKENVSRNNLKLIPEFIDIELEQNKFLLEEDRNSFDYVYEVKHLANMRNWKDTTGKMTRQFEKLFHNFRIEESTLNEVNKEDYFEMFNRWAENKKLHDYLDLNEFKALEKLFTIEDIDIKIISLYVDNTLIGFTVYEIVSDDYAISHFAKADIGFHKASSCFLNWKEAELLAEKNIKYFNWEQDLGVSGLRESKEKYNPIFFLKKFKIKEV